MTKKVLLVVTNHDQLGNTGKQTGWYLPEVAHPYHVFKQANFHVDFVSPKGGKAPVDESSVQAFANDEVSKDFLNDKQVQELLNSTLKPSDIKVDQYSAIFYAGGHGPLWDVTDDKDLAKIAAEIYEKQNGVVSAVCHGPCGLLNIKLSNDEYLVKGKTVAAFTNDEEKAVQLDHVVPFSVEDELVKRGAKHERADNWQACVRVSERVVTGQNPASATPTAQAVVDLLNA